jgi:DNA-binding transcriptional LysR family regulator
MTMIPNLRTMQNRLRLKQLAMIVAIDELRSLRKVAEAMHVSQPAASKMLQEMEESLGVSLFERHSKGLQPTLFGKAVITYAQLMMSDLDNLRKKLVAQEQGGVGELSVGSIMAPCPGLLKNTIIDLKERFPLLKISIQVDTSDVLVQLLDQGKLDLVLGRIPAAMAQCELNFEVLAQETLTVVAGRHHPLATAPQVALKDLGDFPWILQPAASPMRVVLERTFRDAGMATPANLVETASILTTCTLLQASDMIAVVPHAVAQDYAQAGLMCILPVGIKFQLEPYGIITRRERFPDPAVKVFQDCVRRLAMPEVLSH